MNNFVADSETAIRFGVFLAVLTILIILETLYPRRQLHYSRGHRWTVNFGISFVNSLLVRLLIPLAGVGAALFAEERSWGLFNQLALPSWISSVLFLLLFDLVIYLQHRMFHYFPWLWRLHRMHHTDLDYDVSTGNRFHPLSILISGLIKLVLILLIGPLAIAVIMAELLLNVTSMFNHSNLYLPDKVDRILRIFLVTPDMHRIHHSIDEEEHNKNFGFNFPWWDKIFSSYCDTPKQQQQELNIGIEGFQDSGSIQLLAMLAQPFRK